MTCGRDQHPWTCAHANSCRLSVTYAAIWVIAGTRVQVFRYRDAASGQRAIDLSPFSALTGFSLPWLYPCTHFEYIGWQTEAYGRYKVGHMVGNNYRYKAAHRSDFEPSAQDSGDI